MNRATIFLWAVLLWLPVAAAAGPPMPRAAADASAIKGSSDSMAALFARRDVERLGELAAPLQAKLDEAAANAAPAEKAVNDANAAQAAAAKGVAEIEAILKEATAEKAAADKALAEARQAATDAEKESEEAAKRAKAAEDEAAKPSEPDSQSEEEQAALKKALDEANEALAAAEKSAAAAKEQVETTAAAAQEAEKKLQESTARQQKLAADKATADKEVAVAEAALKPLAEAKSAAEQAAAPTLEKLTAARERAELYEAAVPAADPKLTRETASFKHDRPVLSCRFSVDGESVFFGAQDSDLHRRDLVTEAAARLAGHRSWIRRFAMHPDGSRLLSGAYEGRLIWWNPGDESPAPLKEVDAHRGFVRAVAVSPDGRYVATGGNDNFVRVWSADEGQLLAELSGHERHVYNVAFHPAGGHLVSGDLMGVLKQWEVGTWRHVRDFDSSVLTGYDKTFRADCGGIRGMDFSPGGESLVVCGISGVTNAFAGIGTPTAVLFDWETGKRQNVFVPAGKFQGTCWGVQFHPSGDFLIGAGGGAGGGMWFWKPGQDKSFFDYKLPNVAYDVTLHPDGLRLAAAFYDKTIRIYDLGPKTESEKQAEAKAAGGKKKRGRPTF